MRMLGLSLASLLVGGAVLQGADVRLTLNPEWAGQPMAVPSPVKTTEQEHRVRITRLSALLSGFVLRRTDGSTVIFPDTYGWIDGASGATTVMLKGVEQGRYAGLEFTIGLPPDLDAADSGRWPAGHPLNPLTDRMYRGWRGGYDFVALEGNWGTGQAPQRGFSFHWAREAGVMRVRLDRPFEVKGPTVVRCGWDVAALVRALPFEADGQEASLANAAIRAVSWRGQSVDLNPSAESAATPAAGEVPLVVPSGFPQPTLPLDNPLTRAGIELGKQLFSDRRLSGNGQQACVACHRPEHAFSDSAPLSLGAEGHPGVRHSPSLLNLAWQPAYAWDGSAPQIRDQAKNAMTSSFEMNGDLAKICALLGKDPAMARGFAAAFGSPGVNADRIALALEQYVLTLVSADSKFDRAARGEVALTGLEKKGQELFLTEYDPARGRYGADCFRCHGGALFGDYVYRDNGLGLTDDRGRAVITGSVDDEGKFKTPSLRNVGARAPYMHDGRLPDLAAVVAHYSNGVHRTRNLDPNLGQHPDPGIKLSAADQEALVAFLLTLTSG